MAVKLAAISQQTIDSIASDGVERYCIHFWYEKGSSIRDYTTSYATKREAWDYIQALAKKALDNQVQIDLELSDMVEERHLLTMVVDERIAYAMRSNSTGFVVAMNDQVAPF